MSTRSTWQLDVAGESTLDPQWADGLWRRYWRRAVGLARALLPAARRRAADEEDVASMAFVSFLRRLGEQPSTFCRGASASRHWPLLAQITRHKANDMRREQESLKRGGGVLIGESALVQPGPQAAAAIVGVPDHRTGGTELEQWSQAAQCLEDLDDELRWVARLRWEGYTPLEISQRVGRSLPTVERRLRLLRRILAERIGS